MFSRSRHLVAALVLTAAALSCSSEPEFTGCTGSDFETVDAGNLTLSADFSYPPFAYENDDGRFTGFDIELARIIAKEMELELIFANRGAGGLIPGLLAHRQDVAASALRDSPELRDQVCVSTSYLAADLGLLVPRPDPHGIGGTNDLVGRAIAVITGSRAERWANENLTETQIRSVPAVEDLRDAVHSRSVDAALDDIAVMKYAAKQSREFAVASTVKTNEQYVMATSPDKGGLMGRVNAILAELETNGTLGKLRRDWFG